MGGKKYIADAIRQAIKEQQGWFRTDDLVPRVTELVGRGWTVSRQRIGQHIAVYEIPIEKREIAWNRYEYKHKEVEQ